MTFKGFFELRTAEDLFAKLKRDSVRIQNNPLDVDAAFDFSVTAYHMLDWVYTGGGNSHKRKEIENGSMLLQVTSHLANGAKHFEATADRHKAVAKTLSRPGGFQPGAFQTNAFDVGELVVHLEGDVAADLGASISIAELATRLVSFWQQEIERIALQP